MRVFIGPSFPTSLTVLSPPAMPPKMRAVVGVVDGVTYSHNVASGIIVVGSGLISNDRRDTFKLKAGQTLEALVSYVLGQSFRTWLLPPLQKHRSRQPSTRKPISSQRVSSLHWRKNRLRLRKFHQRTSHCQHKFLLNRSGLPSSCSIMAPFFLGALDGLHHCPNLPRFRCAVWRAALAPLGRGATPFLSRKLSERGPTRQRKKSIRSSSAQHLRLGKLQLQNAIARRRHVRAKWRLCERLCMCSDRS